MRHYHLVSAADDNLLSENKNCKNAEVVLGSTSEEVIQNYTQMELSMLLYLFMSVCDEINVNILVSLKQQQKHNRHAAQNYACLMFVLNCVGADLLSLTHWNTNFLTLQRGAFKSQFRRNWQFCTFVFYSCKLIFIDFSTYPCCAVMLGWSLKCLFISFLWCDTP